MKEWKKEKVPVELVRKLNETFKVDYITASLLARRGVTEPKQVQYFLEDDTFYLHNPFLFHDMERFVERVLQAREEQEKVCIFGDRDADGITSTVLLKQELDAMGLTVCWRLPEGDEPYGLTRKALEEVAHQGVSLVITVDCGISNQDEVAYARELGIDVLITDHHPATLAVPAAHAVIDPAVSGCGYPFSRLAGCAVVAKCIWALRFASTDFYQERIILLDAYPGNGTVIIEAVKMKNLVEEDRLIEEVVPGILKPHQSRMLRFLNCDVPILSLDTHIIVKLLNEAFGETIEIHVGELRTRFEEVLGQTAKKSLFSLMRLSRSIRYTKEATELDLLISLFKAYVLRSFPSLSLAYEDLLDLVAIGTVGDLMPMIDENRILVKIGMRVLSEGRRKELSPLLTKQNLIGRKLTTTDIGWQICPLINASGRLGRPQVAARMLLAPTMRSCEEEAQELIRLNHERQKQGEESWARLFPKAQKSHADYGGKFLIVEDEKVSRGLTGVMASRLLRHFNVPSMVLASIDEERVTGSIRSPADFNVTQFLHTLGDLFVDYGGHACAGGFSMEKCHLPSLQRRIALAIEDMEELVDKEKEPICIDAELPPDYLTPDLIHLVETFEPYGEANPPLQFLIQSAVVEDIQYLGNAKKGEEGHVKLKIAYGRYRWPALYWRAASYVGVTFDCQDTVDIVFRMTRNYYRNNETLQLTIIDLRRHKKSIEEIIEETGNYQSVS